VELVLPLVSGGALVGVLLLGHKLSGDVYPREQLELMRAMANQAAIAIANARLYEEVAGFSRQLETQVEERTKELRAFVAAVYHELSAPITTMRGYCDLLAEGKAGALNAKQARFLTSVRKGSERLVRLVSDLADVSRLDDERLTLYPETVDLAQATQEALGAISAPANPDAQVADKGLQIDSSLARDARWVHADPQRLVQILTNLVSNACRFTPAGGQITVSSQQLDGWAEIAVNDTGIGIHREDQDHIFERFFRSDDPRVRAQPGTGLGLSITKSLVELHGGRIWVESKIDQGSTFRFTLPLVPEPPTSVGTGADPQDV
jgi:signal transduction histidine kinase